MKNLSLKFDSFNFNSETVTGIRTVVILSRLLAKFDFST